MILSDKEIIGAINSVESGSILISMSEPFKKEVRAILRAQVQKFIEWSEGYCTEAGCRRLHCGRCWQNLERNLKEDNHDTTNC